MRLGPGGAASEAAGEALSDTIGEMFDIPEADLDNQMVDMVAGPESTTTTIQSTPVENSDAGSDLGDLF